MSDAPDTDHATKLVLGEHRWRVLGVAFAVGLTSAWLAEPTLFGGGPAGIGLALLLISPVLVALLGGVVVNSGPSLHAVGLFAAALAVLPWVAVRSAPALLALDLLAAVGLVAVGVYRYRVDTPSMSLFDHLRVVCWAPIGVLVEPFRFVRDDLEGTGASIRPTTRVRGVVRGLALAIIPVLVFGALLASADAVFSDIVGSVFRVDLGGFFEIGGVALLVAWVVIGLLRFSLGRWPLIEIPRGTGYLGTTEVVTVLGTLAGMFALFVGIQFAYLFGGADTIRGTRGLTTAEYYRQGFFQLVAVAALVTLLVLVLDWWHRTPERTPHRAVVVLFEALIGLTAVMVVSALVRLYVYVDAFGISRLRVYTAAFVVWIAALLILLATSVARGRRDRFAPGAIITAFVVVLALNVVNPDALIARVNIDRHIDDGAELDIGYLGTLSEDAVPTIVDQASGPMCAELLEIAIDIAGEDQRGGFRTFNWSRSGADAAVFGVDVSERC